MVLNLKSMVQIVTKNLFTHDTNSVELPQHERLSKFEEFSVRNRYTEHDTHFQGSSLDGN